MNNKGTRLAVKCKCGRVIYDGEAIKSRCVKPGEFVSYALCKCKLWVKVPIVLTAITDNNAP